MKTLEIAFAGMAVLALVGVANAGEENYGRADDVGSDRFLQVNQCLAFGPAPDREGKALAQCMKDNYYAFMPNAQVWGNDGPKCKDDELGVFHSWCWKKATQE
jgi:hypothetical protein